MKAFTCGILSGLILSEFISRDLIRFVDYIRLAICLSVLVFCSYRFIRILVKSHISAKLLPTIMYPCNYTVSVAIPIPVSLVMKVITEVLVVPTEFTADTI